MQKCESHPHYNHIRPHQALGYLTPAEFLATHHPEVLSRTS